MNPMQQQEAAQSLRNALDTSRWIEPLRETFPISVAMTHTPFSRSTSHNDWRRDAELWGER